MCGAESMAVLRSMTMKVWGTACYLLVDHTSIKLELTVNPAIVLEAHPPGIHTFQQCPAPKSFAAFQKNAAS